MSDALRVYMNDQLASGIVWREFIRASKRKHAATRLGDALHRIHAITAEDIESHERMMKRLGIPRNRAKTVLAHVGAFAARLKRPDRFEELDFILIGVVGKKILWKNLGDYAGLRDRLPEFDFDELLARAQTQLDLVEPFHKAAGREFLRAGSYSGDG